jgi:hypothetical protein
MEILLTFDSIFYLFIMQERAKSMKKLTFGFVCALFILLHCSQNDANPVGGDLFDNSDLGVVNRLLVPASTDTSFSVPTISTGSGSYLYIGHIQDIQAASMIRFTGLEDSAPIDSAILLINVSQVINSTQIPGSVNLYTMTSTWDDLSFKSSDFKPDFIGDYVGTIEVANDSIDTLRYQIDSSLIMQWMDSTLNVPNNGLYLETEDDLMLECFSRDMSTSVTTGPQLLLYFTDDSTRYPASYEATYDLFFASSAVQPAANQLILESGTAFRTFMTFDLGTFAPMDIINRATLILTADTLLTLPDIHQTLYFTACFLDSLAEFTELECAAENSGIGTYESGKCRIDLTPQIQSMISVPLENLGFLIQNSEESSSLQRLVFYSTDADSSLRPTLEITYTLPPTGQI